MYNNTLDYVDKINQTGECSDTTSNKYNKANGSISKDSVFAKYGMWLLGLIISFIPLLAVPFIKFFVGQGDLLKLLLEIFYSSEIIFIGISLIITVLIDFLTDEKQNRKVGWIVINVVVIMFGAMIYGVISATISLGIELKNELLLGFNISYFLFVFLLGTSKYVCELRG